MISAHRVSYTLPDAASPSFKVHFWHNLIERPLEMVEKPVSFSSAEGWEQVGWISFEKLRRIFTTGQGILRLLFPQDNNIVSGQEQHRSSKPFFGLSNVDGWMALPLVLSPVERKLNISPGSLNGLSPLTGYIAVPAPLENTYALIQRGKPRLKSASTAWSKK